MSLLSKAHNIGQTFKNASRVTEIVTILVTHGFHQIIEKIGLINYLVEHTSIPKTEKNRELHLPFATRLRLSFEKLGPSFIKLGQMLSSRGDVFPESITREFEKLQDKVSTLPFSEIRPIIEASLGGPVEKFFRVFHEKPLAAASIAQVYAAETLNGDEVVVKVQRPHITKKIFTDIAIMRGVLQLIDKHVPEAKPFNLPGMLEEFEYSIRLELDFRVEANNIKKISSNLKHLTSIAIPKVYEELSSKKILVLERFHGIRLNDKEGLKNWGVSTSKLFREGAEAFFHMVQVNGLFHGDLHPGNLFVLKDGRLALVDFGIVGRLSRSVREGVVNLFLSIVSEDYETLALDYLSLSLGGGPIDMNALQKDLMDTISPYVGMNLKNMNIGHVLLKSTALSIKYNLKIPKDLLLLFKSLIHLESLGKELDPEFDLLELGQELSQSLIFSRYKKENIKSDIFMALRQTEDLIKSFPKLIRYFLKVWSSNNFALEIKSSSILKIHEALRELSFTILMFSLTMVLLTGGVTLAFVDNPMKHAPSFGIFVLALILILISISKRTSKNQ